MLVDFRWPWKWEGAMGSREIEEVESMILGACLNTKDNDEKREETRMTTSYFVSLWMARHLLREKVVREGEVWEEGEFRDFRLEVPVGHSSGDV